MSLGRKLWMDSRTYLILISVLLWLVKPVSVSGNEILLDMYRTQMPVTFGMYLDLHLKIFSIQNSDYRYEASTFLGQTGGVQLHVKFQRDRLPRKKAIAEDLIEQTSLELKARAAKMLKDLWALYPEEIPKGAFQDQLELVQTFVFLDEEQIGFANQDTFYWKQQPKNQKVVTNSWRGKATARGHRN